MKTKHFAIFAIVAAFIVLLSSCAGGHLCNAYTDSAPGHSTHLSQHRG